jgi:hypothetical protein
VRRRLLNPLTALSLLLCAAVCVLWAVSLHPAVDYRHYVALGRDARAAVSDGRLSLYNTDLPYNGGVIAISPSTGPSPWPVSRGCNFPVYVRHFRWPTHSIWVVTVPLYLPMLLFALLPLLRLRAALRHGKRGPDLCPACDYDLRATPDKCPECGATPARST